MTSKVTGKQVITDAAVFVKDAFVYFTDLAKRLIADLKKSLSHKDEADD